MLSIAGKRSVVLALSSDNTIKSHKSFHSATMPVIGPIWRANSSNN